MIYEFFLKTKIFNQIWPQLPLEGSRENLFAAIDVLGIVLAG